MKKLICFVLVAMILVPCAFAETDYSKLSTEELQKELGLIRNELFSRSIQIGKNQLIFDKDGLQLYTTGKTEFRSYTDRAYYVIEVIFVNNTDKKLSLHTDSCIVNGWEVYCGIVGETSPNTKKRDKLEILVSDAMIEKEEEIEDIRIDFYSFCMSDFNHKIVIPQITLVLGDK